MARRKKLKLPTRFVRIDKTSRTVAIMDKKTGRMKGRVAVRGVGDTTKLRRVTRDVDVNKDGRIDYRGGTVLGRTKKVKVKASKRARSYVRQV